MSMVVEEMPELTGAERYSLNEAADLLGYHYGTVRDYVVQRRVCQHERLGRGVDGSAGRGCLVRIDEHGLATLRRFLPKKDKAAVRPTSSPDSRA